VDPEELAGVVLQRHLAVVDVLVSDRLRSTVLVLVVPVFVMALLGAVSGSLAVAWPEFVILAVIWTVGLVWVWVIGPRRARRV
jgi:tellurite resistance protein TehA-like permease